MDNYIYISKSKLAVLLPQVLEDDAFRKDGEKISVEMGFDLKLIAGKISSEQTPYEHSVSVLKLVERYILTNLQPGIPSSGKSWVSGVMDVRFIRIGKNADIFALIGKYKNAVVLLVGSQAHTAFGIEPQVINTGFSHFPIIEERLMEHWVTTVEEANDEELKMYLSLTGNGENINGEGLGNFELAANIGELFYMANRTEFQVRFLAQRLFWAKSTRDFADNCAMYTPLYVAHN